MKNILIIDDDKSALELAQSVLSPIYKVTAFSGAADALDFLDKNSCDLILVDIDTPDMDGFEIMSEIGQKENCMEIPIVFLSDTDDAALETRCLEAGAMDFIVKPFVPDVLNLRIGRILELEEMRQQLADKLEKKIQEVYDIKSKSRQDVLTGLWNRTYTEERINSIIAEGGTGFLFMIDMDNFKAINDNYGHIEGDNVLKIFAETMKKFSSEDDILCRIGGDEFVMFVNNASSKDEVKKLADGIISDLCHKITEKNLDTNSSVSIGIAQVPENGKDFKSAYNAADKALYYVKQNGKNAYHFFSDHKIEENQKVSTLVDLQYIRELMMRADSGRGAYRLDLDNFHHIYNFIRRFVERSGKNVQVLLFTVYPDENTSQEQIDMVLDILEQAIYSSLRRVDVSTRYSSKQLVVILMDTDTENGDIVAKRIISFFDNLYPENTVTINYDIAKLEGRQNTK